MTVARSVGDEYTPPAHVADLQHSVLRVLREFVRANGGEPDVRMCYLEKREAETAAEGGGGGAGEEADGGETAESTGVEAE